VDREASEDRGDEELLMERLSLEQSGTESETFEWEPALTLSHIIERGLAFPRRAFIVYLTPKRPDLTQVILGFTSDDQLVLGIGLDDEEVKPENEERAREILAQLVEKYACHCGIILVESPPPLDERAFHERKTDPLAIFFSLFPEKASD
jgi:hypothetical protein